MYNYYIIKPKKLVMFWDWVKCTTRSNFIDFETNTFEVDNYLTLTGRIDKDNKREILFRARLDIT